MTYCFVKYNELLLDHISDDLVLLTQFHQITRDLEPASEANFLANY